MKTSVNQKKYFCLYSCCILVDGKNRSCIVDTQRKNLYFIPNSLYFILTRYRNKTIDWIQDYIQNNKILDSYYKFLINNDLGFYTDELKKFPKIDISYNVPNIITNSIIEISDNSNYSMDKVIEELSDLGCETLEIRFLSNTTLGKLTKILDKTEISNLRSIIVVLPYMPEYTIENVKSELLRRYLRITHLYVYNCKSFKIIKSEFDEPIIIYSDQKTINANCCGNINPDYFAPCIEMICESKQYNSCLNKKICISEDGSIKNCPSFSYSFGNVKDTSLLEVVKNERFLKMWNIKKDEIKICKDCEIRYICHDCRAFITDTDDIYSKPLKCGYDPYTNTWES